MNEISELTVEIEKLKARNMRVEAEKAWETSIARKILVAVLTYIVITLFFLVADFQKPFINAIVPTLGFLLSTLSVSVYKKFWLARKNK